MNSALNNLIAALREELGEYGEMLALLDRQQETVIQRNTTDIVLATDAVAQQSQALRQIRSQRQNRQRELARAVQEPEHLPLRELMSRLPSDYHPLLDALVEENNQLLVRVQQRARQNLVLLRRAIDLSQRLVDSLGFGRVPVYDGGGGLRTGLVRQAALYEAVG